jgi:hypothetical protein
MPYLPPFYTCTGMLLGTGTGTPNVLGKFVYLFVF